MWPKKTHNGKEATGTAPGSSNAQPQAQVRCPVYTTPPRYVGENEFDPIVYSEFELPGVSMDDVDIKIVNNFIHLTATRYRYPVNSPSGGTWMTVIDDKKCKGPTDGQPKKERVPTVIYKFNLKIGSLHEASETRAEMHEGLLILATPMKSKVGIPIASPLRS